MKQKVKRKQGTAIKNAITLAKSDNSSITLRMYEGRRRRSIRIGGVWKVDRRNKLKFYLSERRELFGGRKSVVFYGSWFVNRDNYLVYKYTSPTGRQEIVLKGKFEFLSDKSIVYKLDKTETVLKIRGELRGRVDLKKGKIRYAVAVEGRRYRARSVVEISGRWMALPGRRGVSFMVRYGRGVEAVRVRFSKKFARNWSAFVEFSERRGRAGHPTNRRILFGLRRRF